MSLSGSRRKTFDKRPARKRRFYENAKKLRAYRALVKKQKTGRADDDEEDEARERGDVGVGRHSETGSSGGRGDSEEEGEPRPTMCKFFLKGKCDRGKACVFSHDLLALSRTDAHALDPLREAQLKRQERVQARQRAQEERERRERERADKEKQRRQTFKRLQKRTKRGQPIIANVVDHVLGKLERMRAEEKRKHTHQ